MFIRQSDRGKYPFKVSLNTFYFFVTEKRSEKKEANTVTTVLIVSGSVKFFGQFKAAAELTGCEILTATSMSEAKKYLMLGGVGSVVINCPVGDGYGFDEAAKTADTYDVNVLLFVKQELFSDVAAKFNRPDIITLQKPTDRETICAAAQRLLFTARRTPTDIVDGQTCGDGRLVELKIISRAKILLMRQFSMSEAQAHRYIEKRAMDMGRTKKAIAEGIIRSYRN